MKKALLTVKKNAALAMMMAMATLAATPAFAAVNNGNMSAVFSDKFFQTAVTLGFGLFAFYKWVEYFASFSLGSALQGIILPGILTFLTFQWPTVFNWVGLM